MKNLLITLLLLCTSICLHAQQVQEEVRVQRIFAYPEFKQAVIHQTFNRKTTAEANLYLKDASLVYKDPATGKIMKAYVDKIIGVDFDTVKYMKVDQSMARVVAQKGLNFLLCKTTVNMTKYREEEAGGKGMDYFDMPDDGVFMDFSNENSNDTKGIPLMNTYYFNVGGTVIPANEQTFKKFVGKEQKQAFKVLMGNRFWSWKDEESLKMLFDFLP